MFPSSVHLHARMTMCTRPRIYMCKSWPLSGPPPGLRIRVALRPGATMCSCPCVIVLCVNVHDSAQTLNPKPEPQALKPKP